MVDLNTTLYSNTTIQCISVILLSSTHINSPYLGRAAEPKEMMCPDGFVAAVATGRGTGCGAGGGAKASSWTACHGITDSIRVIPYVIEGSLEVKLPTIWTNEKQGREEAERRERLEERRSEKRKSQKKEDADARKGRKVAKHCVFPMIWGSGGSKSRLAKAAGAEPAGQMREEKVHAVVARSTFPSQNVKNTRVRTTFGGSDVGKVHAVAARSTFPSQNVQNTPASDHFWKLRCRKSARRCGAKHISKSKCTKHTSFGPVLEVEMSKKCAPLWREAHFQVKMYKTHHSRTTFGSSDVEKCTPLWREAQSQNVQNTTCSRHFWTLHSTTLHYTTLHYTTLH